MPLSTRKRFRCEVLSWESIAKDARKLSDIIKNSGYKPDIIVAIARGGLVPARLLSDYLAIKDLTTIKVEHWGIAATPNEKAVIKFPLCADIKGRNVLLSDDITDTGDTLRVSLTYLRDFNPEQVRSAVLIHKTSSNVTPDYYVRRATQWNWVIFPWHFWEDLVSFVKEIKADGIYLEQRIRFELKDRYDIEIRDTILKEIIAEAEQ